MIQIQQEERYKHFKVYVRICNRCEEYFEAETKLTRICEKCRPIVNKEKIQNRLIKK